MKTLKLPITNGTFLASDVTVSGTNESTTHNVYVAFTQADSGYVAIQYKVSGSNNWQPMGKVDLTDTEVATFKVSGVITDWRFIVADASGTGSIEVTDSEKLEDIHLLSFYGETGGMSPAEIGGAVNSTARQGIKIAFCGDSITDDSDSGNDWTCWGWVSWFRRNYGSSVDIQPDDVMAVASMGTEHLLSVQLPQVLAGNYNAVFCMIGTNDLGSGVDITGNLRTFYDSLASHGIKCFAMPILPHSSPASYSAANARECEAVNRFIYGYCKNKTSAYFVNTLPSVTDYNTGEAAAGVLRDGIHTTKVGAKTLSDSVYSSVSAMIPTVDPRVITIAGTYDEILNPAGNMISTPHAAGTGGTLQNGATGVVATGWTVRRDSPSAAFSVIASKAARTTEVGESQRVTISGTGDGVSLTVEAETLSGVPGLNDGDVVELEIHADAVGVAGVSYIAARMTIGAVTYNDGYPTSANGDSPSDFSAKYCVRGVYTDGDTIRTKLTAATISSAALSGYMDVSFVSVRKVNVN